MRTPESLLHYALTDGGRCLTISGNRKGLRELIRIAQTLLEYGGAENLANPSLEFEQPDAVVLNAITIRLVED